MSSIAGIRGAIATESGDAGCATSRATSRKVVLRAMPKASAPCHGTSARIGRQKWLVAARYEPCKHKTTSACSPKTHTENGKRLHISRLLAPTKRAPPHRLHTRFLPRAFNGRRWVTRSHHLRRQALFFSAFSREGESWIPRCRVEDLLFAFLQQADQMVCQQAQKCTARRLSREDWRHARGRSPCYSSWAGVGAGQEC